MLSLRTRSVLSFYASLIISTVALAFVVVFTYEACLQPKDNRPVMALCAIASGIVLMSSVVASAGSSVADALSQKGKRE